jgi:5-methylcytosine-specific restriction endonuclease McrA
MADYTKEEYTCIVRGTPYATLHHVYSRKAHPRLAEEKTNMIPVCDDIHKLWHAQGTTFMQNKFPTIKQWLLENGWTFDATAWKWVNYELLRIENG